MQTRAVTLMGGESPNGRLAWDSPRSALSSLPHAIDIKYLMIALSCTTCVSGAWVVGTALNFQPGLFSAAVLTVPSLDPMTAAIEEG